MKMEKVIDRSHYLNQLIRLKDKQLIKVITGIRRCGKSTLFDIYIDFLKNNGIDESQIIRMNLEDPDYHDIQDYLTL